MEHEFFVVHIATFSVDLGGEVHLLRKAQIAYLKVCEALIKVANEYDDLADIFSPKLTVELSKYTRINNHAIELVDDQQLPYSPIYSLGLMKLKILKIYIENNLANGFIRPSKTSAQTSILFNKQPDKSLWLCIDYQDFNNLTIKNQYPLLLVGESLNWLGQTQYFIQFNLTNTYH